MSEEVNSFLLSLYLLHSRDQLILFTGRFERCSLYLYATPVHKFGSKPRTRFFANSDVLGRNNVAHNHSRLEHLSWYNLWVPENNLGPFLLLVWATTIKVEVPMNNHLRDSPLDMDKYKGV